ncbi:asparagine synthase (glutamine-hydrolyzing) [Saccharothrix violaceirubra]|uniref:asparagine synthase (glutamine-hydrolyzing) n=1 Tax=Saccharothrix violaceirubra TaxID=413306 RepID=A0A7W7WWZ1_9PSEU|nr:asparagine synthase (glutamine-hydrolyzing) [Saccharothrix violaceirubra]MBB4966586.1 asparagine synthase (glutamine-hydrolyzing) [Saccharothrix violaceirubra]
MCGITGRVAFDRDLTRSPEVIEAMTATLSRRGPDDSGVWVDGPVALGHTRLAVIDLPGGRQPMVARTPDGPVVLVYSGEVYNHRELRARLRDHPFRTASDTEVVLRGYLEWGEEIAERLDGMYAFAVWDGRRDALVLIRDRMGVKPLYYHPTPAGLVFGSEPKALHADPAVDRVLDTDGLREAVARVKTPGHAFWSGMRELLPGTVLTATRAGLRTRTYWTLSAREHRDDLPTTVATVRRLLGEAVARQSVADVPHCALLSGGLDSSAITVLSPAGTRTMSVEFAGQEHVADVNRPDADAPFVRDVVAHVGTEHRAVVLDAARLADPAVRATAVAAWDLPISMGDLSTSLHLLFTAVRETATVALSGESADELFGGYSWCHDGRPKTTFPWRAALAPLMTDRMYHPDLVASLDVGTYVADRYREALAEVPPGADVTTHLNLTRMNRMLLDRKDRMSMATGLEVRVPFCDTALVEYVYSVPSALTTFDGREKSLLRAAVAPLLPPSVVGRRKAMYPTTNQSAYVSAIQGQAADLLSSDHAVTPLFDTAFLRAAASAEVVSPVERTGLETYLDMAAWVDATSPKLDLN